MLAKRVNLECMKIFRDGGFIQTEMVETIGNLFNNRILWENKSLEIKYYYYQALGYYFASTRLKSDLSVAKIYFQTALFYAFQNFDNHGEIHPKIKQAINHLLWIYGNLNLEFEARNLYDLAFFSEDINGLGYALELMYLESYVYYNLGNIDQAQKILLTCDSLTETIQIVFNSNIRDEIKSLIYGYIVPQNDIKGTFKSRAESLEFVFKFTDDINYQILSELSNLNSIEYKYQKELLADTKMKVEREKKNIRTYSIIAIIIVGMVSAIIIGFAIWKIRRLKNLKFTSDKKAALSQVLARCMSHNIGSHALSKFMDKDVILEKETNEQYPSKFESLSHFANENGNERKELIANFNEYLKYRMDFMADIATTVQPFMETPMYFASNLFKGFDKNRILLNRISGVSSDITYQFKLFFKGGEIKSLESDSNDRKISIPNDVLGAQAFYIIIENVIRNIYKHGNPTKNVEIQIHLDEVENDKSVYQVSIFDNILKRKDDINSLVINRNMAFDEPVLESEENDRLKNKLRTTNLGTIEIAVCAAYLKGLPVTSIENVEKKLNFGSLIIPDDNYHPKNPQHKIIYAYSHCHDEDKYALGYRFYLNKPKQALIVTEGTFSLENKEDLDSIGIKVINPKELATLNHFQQQFVCFYNPADVNLITDSNRALFPKRVVFLNESVSTNSANEFFASIWKQQVTGIGEGYSGAYFVYSREKREISWSNHHHTIKAYIDNHQFNWELYYGSRSQKLADEEPQFIDKADNNLREFEYYEMGCSHSTIQKYINKDLFDTEEAILPFEYLESVFLRVMILDERMQKAIMFEPKKMYANTVPFDEYFKLQHIFIPRKDETDLNAKDLGDYQDEDSEYAKLIKYLCQRIDVVHFCVIHLGLIERMCRPGTDKTNKEIENVIGKLFPEQETRRKIVITSGRGGALNISDDLSFIPLPMLENVLLTQHDKVALTKLLYNSRKFK